MNPICNGRLVQQRVDESDRIRKMKPEERLKLLKKTLKKSTRLTEKLLQRLDREWDDIYKEDSENGKIDDFILDCLDSHKLLN